MLFYTNIVINQNIVIKNIIQLLNHVLSMYTYVIYVYIFTYFIYRHNIKISTIYSTPSILTNFLIY